MPTLFRAILVILVSGWICLGCMSAGGEEAQPPDKNVVPDVPPEVRRYLDLARQATVESINTTKAEIAGKKEELKRIKQRDQREELQTTILILELNVERMVTGDLLIVPRMPERLRVGDIGMPRGNASVIQIVDDRTSLVEIWGDQTVALRGVKTDTIADGSTIGLPKLIYIPETLSYTTVLGAKRTVFVMEPYDASRLEPFMPKRPEPPGVESSAKAPPDEITDEAAAASKLTLAKKFADSPAVYARRLKEIVEKWPATKAGVEAAKLLESAPK